MAQERIYDAVKAFERYGASANLANFNIYKQLIDQILNSSQSDYEILAALRNMINSLNENVLKSEDEIDSKIVEVCTFSLSIKGKLQFQIFLKYEYITHFSALLVALKHVTSTEVERIKLHLSISLVRYIDLIQPDKALYEAGLACRVCITIFEPRAFKTFRTLVNNMKTWPLYFSTNT